MKLRTLKLITGIILVVKLIAVGAVVATGVAGAILIWRAL